MLAEWIQRVGSSVPRGFSRFYILDMLKKKQYTGKELIDSAIKAKRWEMETFSRLDLSIVRKAVG